MAKAAMSPFEAEMKLRGNYDRNLKRAVAEVLLTSGPSPDALLRALQRDFADVIGVRFQRSASLELSVKVTTQHHGTHYFRLIVKGEG